MDELRDDVVWAARQVLAAGYQVTGTPPPPPRDPLAPDADLKPCHPVQPRTEPTEILPKLEHAMDEAEFAEYCCDRPRLSWNGDPDAPGIACENCGYIVAELGSIVIFREEDDAEPGATAGHPDAEQSQKQGKLFE